MINRDFSERLEFAITRNELIRKIAKGVQQPLNTIFVEGPLRTVKNFANGTWLQHPLHPLLVAIPIGGWTVTLLLYLAVLLFDVKGIGIAIGLAMGLGILGALAAIVAGIMDWMDVDPAELSVGLVHGTINIIATILFVISWLMLYTSDWNISVGNFVPALAGYFVITFGAYLGGELVFRLGTMVNRNAYRNGPKDFTTVVGFNDLPENKPQRFEVHGEPILLVRRGKQVYAVGAVCSHYAAPLEKGTLRDDMIECPWHFSHFALQDGSVRRGPSSAPLPLYETQIKDGKIRVKVKRVAETVSAH